MRILQINAVYKKMSTGRTTQELHEYLISKGMESYVAAPDLCNLTENCYKIGNVFDWKMHAALSRVFGLQGYFSTISTWNLLRFIDKIKPDIIHLRNLHGNYINLHLLLDFIAKKNIATVVTLHDSWFYTGKCMYYIDENCSKWMNSCGGCPALKKGNISLFFDRTNKMLIDKKSDFAKIKKLAVVGVSNWIAEDARKSILKASSEIISIYNWIDLEIFQPNRVCDFRKNRGLNNCFIILGVAMHWTDIKGISVINELADILPIDCRIVLVGRLPETKRDNIIYYGEVNNVNELADLYASADIFINPTLRETFGKTTAEAMACGTPTVAYRTTAIPELLGEDGLCGEIVSQRTAKTFYESIMNIKNKGKQYYISNCRDRAVKMFDKEKGIQQYIELYRRLMEG